jgi:hypothetical protein
MSAPAQQQMGMQQACQITHEVLGHMIKLFETVKEPNGHRLANDEVLLSLKHTKLLLPPFLHILHNEQKKAQGQPAQPVDKHYYLPERKLISPVTQ